MILHPYLGLPIWLVVHVMCVRPWMCPWMSLNDKGIAVSYCFVLHFFAPNGIFVFSACLLLSVFAPAWWDPIRSKPVAGYWHDEIDCCMVLHHAGDHFWANFSIKLILYIFWKNHQLIVAGAKRPQVIYHFIKKDLRFTLFKNFEYRLRNKVTNPFSVNWFCKFLENSNLTTILRLKELRFSSTICLFLNASKKFCSPDVVMLPGIAAVKTVAGSNCTYYSLSFWKET